MVLRKILIASLLLSAGATAIAQGSSVAVGASTSPSLHLEATSTTEVLEDTAWANLVVEQSARDANNAQRQVSDGLARALDVARHTEHLQVKTTGFYTTPVYAADGRISAWRSRAELRIESTQTQLVARTAADLSDVARVDGAGFFLSGAARAAAEQGLISSAVKDFGDKATVTAHALGFVHTQIRDVSVSQSGGDAPRPMMAFAMKSARAESASPAPVPMEPGRSQVSVTVSGTVELQN